MQVGATRDRRRVGAAARDLPGLGFARSLAIVFSTSLLLIAALTTFLIEVRMEVAAIRVRDELLERS